MCRNVFIRLKRERRLAVSSLLVVLIIPCADGRVESCTCVGWVGKALFGGGVGADEGGEVRWGKAL